MKRPQPFLQGIAGAATPMTPAHNGATLSRRLTSFCSNPAASASAGSVKTIPDTRGRKRCVASAAPGCPADAFVPTALKSRM